MKSGPILLVVALALGGGLLIYQLSSSNQPGGDPTRTLAQGASAPAGNAGAPVLRNDAAGTAATRVEGQGSPQAEPVPVLKAAAGSGPAGTGAVSPELELPVAEGSLPTARPKFQPSAEERDLEAKYANGTSEELMAAYQSLNDFYQMHFDGRITDKSQLLAPAALQALQREIGWLKERAINGKPDSDG
jgi:hypothetical protein